MTDLPPIQDIETKLGNPDATFTQAEIYAAFELLAERYGFYRDQRLPERNSVQETTSMTVDGFEHLGVLIIRPRTLHDSMIDIPSLVDEMLKGNFYPSQNTIYNATAIAMAKSLIVSPPGLVERLLESTDSKDFQFFNEFGKQYQKWMNERVEAAREKKSGPDEEESGISSASSSETTETSSPQIAAG
ncbi:MAG: hypothetical protein F6K42_08720 [Leptolyngbya sp. SIO1D8]|nr:hypothetical protein [Leptolyngbya sp. SIO1D8]